MKRIAWIFIASLLFLTGCERWSLDRQMEELCQKEGLFKVYEKVTLPSDLFYENGDMKHSQAMALGMDPNISFERIGDDDYRVITKKEYLVGNRLTNLQNGDGVLIRMQVTIVRWKDKRLLGEQVWFYRGGGDFFTFGFQPSGSTCPLPRMSLSQSIFIKGE